MALTTYRIPSLLEGIIFDIDNTLYDDTAYGTFQIDALIGRLAEELGRDRPELAREVEEHRRQTAEQEEGRRPSLGNTFLRFYGIPIATSVEWREEIMRPEEFLSPDIELRQRVETLSRRYALAAVTNNPRSIGQRTLHALGLGDLIPVVSGLDTCGVSKPDPRPFEIALEYLALPPSEILAVGDRYEIDLEPIIQLGGGGALVESRDDLLMLLDSTIEGTLA